MKHRPWSCGFASMTLSVTWPTPPPTSTIATAFSSLKVGSGPSKELGTGLAVRRLAPFMAELNRARRTGSLRR